MLLSTRDIRPWHHLLPGVSVHRAGELGNECRHRAFVGRFRPAAYRTPLPAALAVHDAFGSSERFLTHSAVDGISPFSFGVGGRVSSRHMRVAAIGIRAAARCDSFTWNVSTTLKQSRRFCRACSTADESETRPCPAAVSSQRFVDGASRFQTKRSILEGRSEKLRRATSGPRSRSGRSRH